jgi:hypothetical protein
MEQFKRAKVILLPTNDTINVLKGYKDKSLLFQYKEIYKTIEAEKSYVSNYHLYIISDDEIKENDWFILNNGIKQLSRIRYSGAILTLKNGESSIYGHDFKYCKKIIATTDTSLTIMLPHDVLIDSSLPQPSQSFITKYIEYYNKGEVITDVLVEYEYIQSYSGNTGLEIKDYLKINPKDNTITIKKLKDSWNREEVIELIKKFNNEATIHCNGEWIRKYKDSLTYNEIKEQWIKENL